MVDTVGTACSGAHSDDRHGVCPYWWGPAVAGEYWLIERELFCFSRGYLLIFREGVFQTAYPATSRHVQNVLVSRLERMGWRALFRAPRVGRKAVLRYFGIVESASALVLQEA